MPDPTRQLAIRILDEIMDQISRGGKRPPVELSGSDYYEALERIEQVLEGYEEPFW